MTYTDTISWMFKQLPMYQRQGKAAFKKDLTNTLRLAAHLKHPENKFKTLHVAGTNGKGSTSHMLASILQKSGFKVGLYTSPHLKDFRERIKINGKVVSKQFVIAFIKKNKPFLVRHKLSFFEMTVGMAFDFFAKKKVDIAIIEVGLGGRLDSTNIIKPQVSVITNISLDHTQFLGNTFAEIAKEKAGIIKPNVPVVVGETQSKTTPVFNAIAKKNHARIFYADKLIQTIPATDLLGKYQQKNIKTVLQTIAVLKLLNWKIPENAIKNGLQQVVNNTGLKGRWQVLQQQPKVICDTAHNPEGLKIAMQQLLAEKFTNLHIVFGVVNDKDLAAIVSYLPKQATYYFCEPDVPRAMPAKGLAKQLIGYGFLGKVYGSVNEAYTAALKNAVKQDLVYVGGSTFVVAEII